MTSKDAGGNDFLRLLGPIGTFEGNKRNVRNASMWLNNFNRIREGAQVNDKNALLIVGLNLRGESAEWWDEFEDQVKTWEEFEGAFKDKYLGCLESDAWSKIRSIRQGNRQIGEFITELISLFKTVDLTKDELKIGFFVDSINPEIGYELEKEKEYLKSYSQWTEKAKEIEKLNQKYAEVRTKKANYKRKVNFNLPKEDESVQTSNDSVNSRISGYSEDSISELIEAVNKLTINMVNNQRPTYNNSNSNNNSNNNNNIGNRFNRPPFEERRMICWNCGKEGHPSRYCREPTINRNTPNLTGENTTDMGKEIGSH